MHTQSILSPINNYLLINNYFHFILDKFVRSTATYMVQTKDEDDSSVPTEMTLTNHPVNNIQSFKSKDGYTLLGVFMSFVATIIGSAASLSTIFILVQLIKQVT